MRVVCADGRRETRYLSTLRIMGDPFGEIRGNDPELWDEIERDRIEGDSDEDAVLRWLGGLLDELEDQLNALLPMNWYAKIEDGKVGK